MAHEEFRVRFNNSHGEPVEPEDYSVSFFDKFRVGLGEFGMGLVAKL